MKKLSSLLVVMAMAVCSVGCEPAADTTTTPDATTPETTTPDATTPDATTPETTPEGGSATE